MIRQVFLLCFALLVSLGHAAPVASTKENINFVHVSGINFDEVIKSHEYALVDFYNPKLQCSIPKFVYVKAAELFSRKTGSHIFLAHVNGYETTNLAQKYQFDPHNCPAGLQFFHNGEPEGFMNESSIERIVAWLMQKHGKSAIRITSAQEAKQFALSDDLVVLGLFKDIKSKAAKEFLAANQQMALVSFGLSDEVKVFKKYNVTGDSAVLVLKKFDDPIVVYRGEMNFESIANFVKTESIPLLFDSRNDRHLEQVYTMEKKGVFYLIAGEEGVTSNITESVHKAAKRFRVNTPFLMFHPYDSPNVGFFLRTILGVDRKHLPAIRYYSETKATYKPSQDGPEFFTAENVMRFAQEALAGKLEPIRTMDYIG